MNPKKGQPKSLKEILREIDPSWNGGPLPVRTPGRVVNDSTGYDLALAKASVGAGWHPLLERIFEAKPAWAKVVQVKEKFGGLRIYWEHGPIRLDIVGGGSGQMPRDADEEDLSAEQRAEAASFDALIRSMEDESIRVCEICGSPGELRSRTWAKTLCEACSAKPGTR